MSVAVIRAARMMERLRIVELLQDDADVALGNGDVDYAMRIASLITSINGDELGVEEVDEVREVPDQGGELPEVQLNTDEADAARLLRAHPRMRSAAEDFLRD